MKIVKRVLALWAAYCIGHRVGWGRTHPKYRQFPLKRRGLRGMSAYLIRTVLRHAEWRDTYVVRENHAPVLRHAGRRYGDDPSDPVEVVVSVEWIDELP